MTLTSAPAQVDPHSLGQNCADGETSSNPTGCKSSRLKLRLKPASLVAHMTDLLKLKSVRLFKGTDALCIESIIINF